MAPEVLPGVGQDREWHRVVAQLDLLGGTVEAVVRGAESDDAFAVDPHDIASAVVIDHRLVSLAILGAAEEEAAVGAEVILHFEDHLEGDRMAFDYRLKPGPVRKGNALGLMRAVGLEV